MGIMAKNTPKSNGTGGDVHLSSPYTSKFVSNALSKHMASQSRFFWRGNRLLQVGKRGSDIPAFPIWQILLEILNLLERREEYKLGIVKGGEFLFNKISYKGVAIYENKTLSIKEDTLPDFLGSLLLKLLNEA